MSTLGGNTSVGMTLTEGDIGTVAKVGAVGNDIAEKLRDGSVMPAASAKILLASSSSAACAR
jgi:hypothetical protein